MSQSNHAMSQCKVVVGFLVFVTRMARSKPRYVTNVAKSANATGQSELRLGRELLGDHVPAVIRET